MNCSQISDNRSRKPGCPILPPGMPSGPGPVIRPELSGFPIGMGYVPIQSWETLYPVEYGFQHGTIFPSLDYPFVVGRCWAWQG